MEVNLLEITCQHCGKTWTPRIKRPVQCPHCKSARFNGPGEGSVVLSLPSVTCKRCHKTWTPRIKRPVQCPYCKSARFDEDPVLK